LNVGPRKELLWKSAEIHEGNEMSELPIRRTRSSEAALRPSSSLNEIPAKKRSKAQASNAEDAVASSSSVAIDVATSSSAPVSDVVASSSSVAIDVVASSSAPVPDVVASSSSVALDAVASSVSLDDVASSYFVALDAVASSSSVTPDAVISISSCTGFESGVARKSASAVPFDMSSLDGITKNVKKWTKDAYADVLSRDNVCIQYQRAGSEWVVALPLPPVDANVYITEQKFVLGRDFVHNVPSFKLTNPKALGAGAFGVVVQGEVDGKQGAPSPANVLKPFYDSVCSSLAT
jgi:hypothetical protein